MRRIRAQTRAERARRSAGSAAMRRRTSRMSARSARLASAGGGRHGVSVARARPCLRSSAMSAATRDRTCPGRSTACSSARCSGHFPTGVTIVTGWAGDEPAGFTIGSFTSVSLDPPLVGFLPQIASDTWQAMAPAGLVLRQRPARRPGRAVLAVRQERRRRRPLRRASRGPTSTDGLPDHRGRRGVDRLHGRAQLRARRPLPGRRAGRRPRPPRRPPRAAAVHQRGVLRHHQGRPGDRCRQHRLGGTDVPRPLDRRAQADDRRRRQHLLDARRAGDRPHRALGTNVANNQPVFTKYLYLARKRGAGRRRQPVPRAGPRALLGAVERRVGAVRHQAVRPPRRRPAGGRRRPGQCRAPRPDRARRHRPRLDRRSHRGLGRAGGVRPWARPRRVAGRAGGRPGRTVCSRSRMRSAGAKSRRVRVEHGHRPHTHGVDGVRGIVNISLARGNVGHDARG